MNVKFINFILMGLMFAAFGSSIALRPNVEQLSRVPKLNLEKMIPMEFAGWHVDTNIHPVVPSPDQQAAIERTYDQTLSRTYVNEKNQRVMLSIAYSSDYSGKSIQYHRPDICYPAQGFEILSRSNDVIRTDFGNIQVSRLSTKNNIRLEPVTYWVTVAGNLTTFGLSVRWLQVISKLTGKLPDGLLVRFSSIDHDTNAAYLQQDDFAKVLLAHMRPWDAAKISGSNKADNEKK